MTETEVTVFVVDDLQQLCAVSADDDRKRQYFALAAMAEATVQPVLRCSQRSRGTPLVSGTKRRQKHTPSSERAAYNRKVQTLPRRFNKLRKVRDTKKLLSQLAMVATLAARPRILSGKNL
jgi:hypothetical protein